LVGRNTLSKKKRVDEVTRIRSAVASWESVFMEAEKNAILTGTQAMEVNKEIQVQEVLSEVREEVVGDPVSLHPEDNQLLPTVSRPEKRAERGASRGV
jgi:hypothetical protein